MKTRQERLESFLAHIFVYKYPLTRMFLDVCEARTGKESDKGILIV